MKGETSTMNMTVQIMVSCYGEDGVAYHQSFFTWKDAYAFFKHYRDWYKSRKKSQ